MWMTFKSTCTGEFLLSSRKHSVALLITHHQFEHTQLKVIQLGHQTQEVFYVDDI
ncbi:MAG: hypothetical protein HRU38_19680 [Saccharospirillaceae bacterium]|nr:hypothetical protein [Pseudomonadales bacterium]NRB80858.1 hypothetical protein [Saccharospirillaceae bacterium]